MAQGRVRFAGGEVRFALVEAAGPHPVRVGRYPLGRLGVNGERFLSALDIEANHIYDA
jgi:hypothetical protein